MARLARIVVPEVPHHVTQRGNRRADVFLDDADRSLYLALFRHYSRRFGLDAWAYCLMNNHVHWIVVPRTTDALARVFQGTHAVYAQCSNTRHRQSGHLWQGRFFSCPLDESHLWAAVRYIERNPVRANMVRRAEDYPWSSTQPHCGLRTDPTLSPGFPPGETIADWSAWLTDEDTEHSDALRRGTHTGRPCGSRSFIDALEGLLHRSLRPRPPGRRLNPDRPKTKKLRIRELEGQTTD